MFRRSSSARYRSISRASSDMDEKVFVQSGSGPPAYLCVSCLLVAPEADPCLFVEMREKIERDVCRLVVRSVRLRDVVAQGDERRLARHGGQRLAPGERGGVPAGDQSCRDRLDV